MTVRIVAIKDGSPVTLDPRVEAMCQLVVDLASQIMSSPEGQGWIDLHWDGRKVHSKIKHHGGVRTIDVTPSERKS